MAFQFHKKIAIFGFISILMAAVIFLSVFFERYKENPFHNQSSLNQERPLEAHISAYAIALARAREWKNDAAPSYFELQDANAARFIFVSGEEGVGFAVEVVSDAVTSAQEISYTGFGAEIPEETITPEEAIKRVQNMAGYESALIEGVEAVYGREGQVWYWGVKTDKGTVSVEAR